MDLDITGLDSAALVAAMHNHTSPVGFGRFHARGDLTREEAVEILAAIPSRNGRRSIEYLYGRPIMADLTDTAWESADMYDRDAGAGTAQRIVDALRSGTKA